MSTEKESNHEVMNDWNKFVKYLWFDEDINMWLDISKVLFNEKKITEIERKFKNVYKASKDLEDGSISNVDENRQVGHYWLRNSNIAPDKEIGNQIEMEVFLLMSYG